MSGCMPTKSLLESAEVYDIVNHANRFGVLVDKQNISIDWKTNTDEKITNRNATRPRNPIFNEEK